MTARMPTPHRPAPPPPRAPRLAGAASTALHPILSARARGGRVLAATRYAAYVALDDRPGIAFAVETADAVRMPFGVRLAATSGDDPLGAIRSGDPVTVGEGMLSLSRLDVRVVRWWSPTPVLGPVSTADLVRWHATLVSALRGSAVQPSLGSDVRAARFGAALEAQHPNDTLAAAAGLVGLGPGSTPSGDDVVASALATMRLLAPHLPACAVLWRECGDPLAEAVASYAEGRTTALSAALLRHAARGEPTGELGGVLAAASGAEADGSRAARAAQRLLGVGHTSGADCLQGVVAVATALVRAQSRDPRSSAEAGPATRRTAT